MKKTLTAIKKAITGAVPGLEPDLRLDGRGILTLSGGCESWNQVVDAGHAAAKIEGVKNVVNKLTVKGAAPPRPDYDAVCALGREAGVIAEADVLIIGAGISGCGIARELAKYDLRILVAEKGDDAGAGATKSNNGNIHPGHAVKPGTLKARLNVEGNRMYTQWARELGFELQRSGAMGFVTNYALVPALRVAYNTAMQNGVDGVELVDGARARELEPGLNRSEAGRKAVAALWLPSMGLVEPYKVAVALAENAAANGVRFMFNCAVGDILREDGRARGAVTSRGLIRARLVINCAGVYADDISAMAGDECFTIHPRKGVIAILDKARRPEYDSLCEHITFEDVKRAMKKQETKGGGMCRTPEWNILMGPSAVEIPDKEDLSTSPEELAYSMGRGEGPAPYGDIIRFFAGNRPADYSEDFVIEMSPVTHGFVNVAAIQSPGLAAAPAIARMVEGIVGEASAAEGSPLKKKADWQPLLQKKREFRNLTREEQDGLIKENPAYGRVICRCESITEGEILEVLKSPVVPASVDAVKRRTRAGMGRCQGGFCQPRVVELMARELGISWPDVVLKGPGSNILIKENREDGESA
ncbi:MAG: FAD-dependent oxidoreductase [Clostridiales bacterium]|jgi:glycerol-3-phosphate dehydrogenase|nr:FAD-dependent oxidoreductase [Clostridiales bacterium]